MCKHFCLLLCLVGAGAMSAAHAQEGNLVRNPGFEEPAAKDAYSGWTFVDHGQAFARGQIQAQDYKGGLKAATVTVAQPPKVYVSWAQHVPVPNDDALPDEVSLWYRTPDGPCQVVLGYIGIENGKAVPKGGEYIPLPQSRDWTKATGALEVPFGTRDIQLELRVTKEGHYAFDEVSLVRRETGTFTGKPNRILFVGGAPNATWQEPLKAAGWAKVSTEVWENLTAGLLRRCRLVVLTALPARPEITPDDEATIGLLADYVQAGGGLLLTQQSGQQITGMILPFALAERFGTRILFEETTSDKALSKQVGPWGPDTYTYTEQVSGPVAQGVKGVLYQSAVHMGSLAGVLPFLPAVPWQVTLAAGPNSSSEPTLVGLEEMDGRARAKGFEKDVPLAGIREMGKGRVGYCGLYADNLFCRLMRSDEDRMVHETYLSKGWEGHKSDLQRFLLNTFDWLSANADSLAGADLAKKQPAAGAPLTTAWRMHQGIIGARTAHSSGTSTAEEYAARAKAAGLDFIVFLEEFAALKPGGFEALKKECRRLTGGGFVAVPGITYENTDGNHEYAFGDSLKLPSRILLDAAGKRFKVYQGSPEKDGVCLDQTWLYQLLGFENCAGWYLFTKNPYPHFDTRDVNSMAVVTQEGGKTLEKVPHFFGQEARNGQYLWPLALTLMKDAGEIDLVKQGTYFRNVIGAAGTEQVHRFFNNTHARSARNLYPGVPPFGMISATSGPLIELSLPRGDTDAEANIWNPNLHEWELSLKVTSPAGLQEVVLMDGDTPIRRFLPGGEKEFSLKTSLSRERQKHIWARATDTAGGEAFTRDSQSDSWLLREYQCADRNNQLLYSMQKRADGTPFYIGYGGDTVLPDKGPWNGRVRPVGCFVFDQKLGVGAMAYDGSPEQHPQAHFAPSLVMDGKRPESVGWTCRVVAGREGAPHVQPNRVVASSEVLVGERILDGVFPVDAKPVIHVWHTLYPVQPSQFLKSTARASFYLAKPDGITAYLWEQSFEILQDVPLKPAVPYAIRLGHLAGSTATERLLVNAGQVADKGPLKAHGVKVFPFNKGDYLGLVKSPFGSMVAYSLTDGLVLEGDGVNYGVGLKAEGALLKAGTKVNARVLLVGMHRMVPDPEALAAKVAADYGLGAAPAYQVAVEKGKVLGQEYVLRLDAGTGRAFQGRLTGLKDLAGNLGCTVAGLNDRWTAFLQARGEKTRTRILPVEQGLGYVVLRADEEGRPLAIGHPLVCDRPEVVLSITRTKDWKSWQLEAHNPTDNAVTATVKSNPAFTGFHFQEKIALPAGKSVFRPLGEASL